jgi:hypothetical protein
MAKYFITVVLPTFGKAWELSQVLYALEHQRGLAHSDYELLILNDKPEDFEVRDAAADYYRSYSNVRYVEIYSNPGITNATYAMNMCREYAKGNLLILMVDSGRIPTPGSVAATRQAFEEQGPDICTTINPYHIGKHYFRPEWTVVQCRELMEKIRWREDPYRLFEVAAHTHISRTGDVNESTFQGITYENFVNVGGEELSFTSWGPYNIDFWRRCTKPKPKDDRQIVGQLPEHWGPGIGFGLRPLTIAGEGTFHIHHEVTAERDLAALKTDDEMIWKHYASVGECIKANILVPDWGRAKGQDREIDLAQI